MSPPCPLWCDFRRSCQRGMYRRSRSQFLASSSASPTERDSAVRVPKQRDHSFFYLDGGDGPLIFGIDETLERRAPRSGRGPSTATRCVPAGLRWSRPAACVASLMWLGHVPWAGCHWPCRHGAGAFEPVCQQQVTPALPTGPARWSCNCAGCPTDPWCWWATTAMPCWICSTAASPLNPLP